MFNIHINKKTTKVIITFLILVIFIQILCPIVYANKDSFYKAMTYEGPNKPTTTPPDDPMQEIPPTLPSNKNEDIIKCNTKISGQVFEDMGHIKVVTPNASSGINENNTEKEPIEGVIVNLYNSNNNKLVSTIRTDKDGKYSFTPADGTYYTEFIYGDTTGANFNSNEEIKNILKYNGHDYITVKTPGENDYIDCERLEVINSGKGALQLYIAIDCSYSMRYEEIDGKKRLDIIVDSAKKLCNSLLDLDENIYIGLVFFSGTNYRAASLTKNKTLLVDALDDIQKNNWSIANTDIYGALDKTYNSYYNNGDDSNRYLVLLSDGMPTSDGSTIVYSDDSYNDALNKIKTINKRTKEKLINIQEKGVHTISLFTKTDIEEENAIVQDIFKNDSDVFINLENADETVKVVEKQLNNFISIKAKNESKEYTTSHTVLAGYEDKDRREEVDSIFKDNLLNYNNTIMFDQIENYTIASKDVAQELSEKTKMRVIGGENYIIKSVPNPSVIEEKDKDGNVIKTTRYVESYYDGEDVYLAKRPEFSLSTNVTATNLKITLSNGVVQTNQTKDVGAGPDEFILEYIDGVTAYGSEVDIEYTINIKNTASIQCNYLEVLVQIPKGFKYKGTTGNFLVESVSPDDLINNKLATEDIDKERRMLKITLDNEGKGENGFYISSGGEYNIPLTVSRVTSGYDDPCIESIDNFCAEVLQYKNDNNKRMTRVEIQKLKSGNVVKLLGVYPGDSKNVDFTNSLTNSYVVLIPPTGGKSNILTIKIGIILISFMGLGITILIHKIKKII